MKCSEPRLLLFQSGQRGRENKEGKQSLLTRLKSVPYLRWSSSRLSLWSSWKTRNRIGVTTLPADWSAQTQRFAPSPAFPSVMPQRDWNSCHREDKLGSSHLVQELKTVSSSAFFWIFGHNVTFEAIPDYISAVCLTTNFVKPPFFFVLVVGGEGVGKEGVHKISCVISHV